MSLENVILRYSELLPRPLNLPPDCRYEASPGALGDSLPAPSKLDESPEGAGNVEDALADATIQR